MKPLEQFNETELKAVLALTKLVADSLPKEPANFNELSETESLAHAARNAKLIQERRNRGQRGRVLLDISEEDFAAREQVRKFLKSKGILPKEEDSI